MPTSTPNRLRHLASAPSPRAEADLVRARESLAAIECKLYETFVAVMPAWTLRAASDPFAYGLNGFGGLTPTGTVNDRRAGRDVPLFWSELDLRGYRVMSRQLCDTNQFAIGFTNLLVGYHVRRGYGWQACKRGVSKSAYPTVGAPVDPLIAKAQHVLDTWRDMVVWPLKSRAAFRRWRRDGDVFGRFFPQGHGRLPAFRFVEPEQVGSPTGSADDEDSFGIRTERGDIETPLAYHVWDMDSALTGEWVDAAKIVHAKANVDSDIKRGLPDFFPLAESLDGIRRLLHTMLATAVKQARIAWREKLAAATPEIAANTGVPVYPSTATNRLQPDMSDDLMRAMREQFGRIGINGFAVSDVVKAEGTREWEPGPTMAGAAQYIEVEQAILRAVGVRWNFPEYFSGDASNNNFASSLVASAPFAVTVEGSQYEWGAVWERPVALAVLDYARDAGLLSWAERAQLDVEVIPPAVATADPRADSQIISEQLQNGIICLDTARLKLGYDPQHEAEGVAKDRQARQQP
jgi:hypothetical protein